MKTLIDILPEEAIVKIVGSKTIPVTELESDSRKVGKGHCFIAMKGFTVDGHDYISSAVKNGARSIICERLPDELDEGVSYVQLDRVDERVAAICKAYYSNPSSKIKLIGITGTNGKTTIVNLLFDLFRLFGKKAGLISTIENKIGDQIREASHTTPDIISLYRLLAEMVNNECEFVFMEVSSHAIDQGRIKGLDYEIGVFTNLSHDHLDYHKSFKEYLNTKKKFFDGLASDAYALINTDDKNGSVMVQNCSATIKKYGLKKLGDFKAKILDNSLEGLHLNIDEVELHCRLIGDFNAYNLLAAYGVAICLGFDKMETLIHLSKVTAPDGRFDWIRSEEGIYGIVDYAHTPDALEKILVTLNKLTDDTSSVITVVGCGGDRDRSKRPKMAQIAASLSGKVVLTSDNPRTEDPHSILDEMKNGLSENEEKNALVIEDREQAIKIAVSLAKKGDIVLIAGKGHEKYQEIKGKKFPFDDKEKLSKYLL